MHRVVFLVGLILTMVLVACAPGAAITPMPSPQVEATPVEATVPPTPTALPEVPPTPTALPEAEVGPVELPYVDPATVEGDSITAGSSTVFPLAERLAERFREEGYAGSITIDSVGTGGGFERFCQAGETDIANASRPIKDSEAEACRAIGREPVEFRVGTDALAITVSAENDFVEALTLEELAAVFSGGAVLWSDVNPEWPDEEIQRFSPGTASGTFDYFVEEVLDDNAEALLSAPNLQLSEDDSVLVLGILGSRYAIGYFGYAYYQANRDRLRSVAIDGVKPDAATVEDGTYPLARPLFIYSAPSIMNERPQVAAFINYFLQTVNDEIGFVGYFPASEEALNEARRAWLQVVEQ
jgi:phosphate binding protein